MIWMRFDQEYRAIYKLWQNDLIFKVITEWHCAVFKAETSNVFFYSIHCSICGVVEWTRSHLPWSWTFFMVCYWQKRWSGRWVACVQSTMLMLLPPNIFKLILRGQSPVFSPHGNHNHVTLVWSLLNVQKVIYYTLRPVLNIYLITSGHLWNNSYKVQILFDSGSNILKWKTQYFSMMPRFFTEPESSNELSSQIITSKSLIMLRGLLKLITD